MQEKRQFPRFACMLKAKFHYFDGDPDNPELQKSKPVQGKGRVLDISRGGIFIVSFAKTGINLPIEVTFKTHKGTFTKEGTIIRTGLIRNNPAELLKKFNKLHIHEDAYLAINFDEPLAEFDNDHLILL